MVDFKAALEKARQNGFKKEDTNMANQQQQDITGSIYIANGFTGKSDKAPTAKGLATIEGLGFAISLWRTEPGSTLKNGKEDKTVYKGRLYVGDGANDTAVGWVKVFKNEKEDAWADFYGFIDVDEDETNLSALNFRFNVQKHGKAGLLVGFITENEREEKTATPKAGTGGAAVKMVDDDDIPF